MAVAFKCDRCGEFQEGRPSDGLAFPDELHPVEPYFIRLETDANGNLCDKCLRLMMKKGKLTSSDDC